MTIPPLDGYVRVSRVEGRKGEGFISPDVQERAILDWAKRNDRQVVMQPHELNVSGAFARAAPLMWAETVADASG